MQHNRKTYKPADEFPTELFLTCKNVHDLKEAIVLVQANGKIIQRITRQEWREKWENFPPDELACRGTGRLRIAKRILDALQDIRPKTGPLHIRSGYRSPEHNRKVPNSAKNSMHIHGFAVDISTFNKNAYHLRNLMKAKGFRCQINYPKSSFAHFDLGPEYVKGWDESSKEAQDPNAVYDLEGETQESKDKTDLFAGAGATIPLATTLIDSIGNLGLPQYVIVPLVILGVGALGWVAYKKLRSK